jgi:quercetin dioxygenase-like cupin family protein
MHGLFINYKDVPWIEVKKGIRFKPIIVNNVGGSLVEFDKGASTEPQSHADEQMSWCLKGKLEFMIEDDNGRRTEIFEEGMAYGLEPYVRHAITRAIEDSVVIEVWSPPERQRKRKQTIVIGEAGEGK